MERSLIFVCALLVFAPSLQSCSAKPAPGSPGSPGTMFIDPSQPKWPNAFRPKPGPINPYIAKDPGFGPWIAHHDRYLKRQWQAKPFSGPVTCQVTVNRAGDVSNIQLKKSSGSAADDKAAVELINNFGPFRPLPASVPSQEQTFLVEFLKFPTVFVSKVESAPRLR